MLESIEQNNILSFEDKKNKLIDLVKQGEYKSKDAKTFELLFSGTATEREQLKAHCLSVINNKNEEKTFNRIYNAAKKEIMQAHNSLENELPFLNDNGGVNEGLFTEYCLNKIDYIVVSSKGKNNSSTYIYNNGVYEEISRDDFRGLILSLLPVDKKSDRIARAVYNNLSATTDNKRKKNFEELNGNFNIINMKNGLYNINTGELLPHTSEEYSTLQINCNYNKEADCPLFMDYLKELQTKEDGAIDYEGIRAIQEYIGILLSNIPVFEKLKAVTILYSRIGNTGKSVLIDVIINLLGSENIAVQSIQGMGERFGTAGLYGKRLVVNGDQTRTEVEDSSVFKAITGYDPIFAERKGKDGFHFTFKGGGVFACNGLPLFKDDKGNHIYNRLIIVPCTNVIPEDKQDPTLRDKLKNELDGIFLWAMQGLKRLRSNNWRITQSSYMKEVKNEYRAECDTVFAYLNECYVKTDYKTDRVKVSDFYSGYSLWCRDTERNEATRQTVTKRMESNGFRFKKTLGDRYYLGLKPKEFREEKLESDVNDDVFK